MKYRELVDVYEKLESTTKRLEKTHHISQFLKKISEDEAEMVVLLLQGSVFPNYDERKIGVAARLVLKALNVATGNTVEAIEKEWKKIGDLGLVAEKLCTKKKQSTLFSQNLTVKKVFDNLRKLPELSGEGTVDNKIKLITELLTSAEPKEAKFIVRSLLEELRVGVAEGTLRDAIVWANFAEEAGVAYDEKAKEIKVEDREKYNSYVTIVQEAFDVLNDYAKVAIIAKYKGESGLKKLNLEVGKPIRVMLFQKAHDIADAFERVGKPCAFEYKYDGFRLQIHKKNDKITLYTRQLENVTKQFPEVVKYAQENVKAKEYILEGEAVGYDPKTKKYKPFQFVSQRIKRKHDIDEIAKKLPVELNIFEVILLDGKNLIKETYKERREIIEKLIKEEKWKIVLAKQIVTSSEKDAKKFYEEALADGQEGTMAKNLEGIYKPGSRVGFGVKVKPVMDTLDLVIVGAEWGEGKRSKWLSSFTIACLNEDTDEFLEVGNVGTGIKELEGEGVTFDQLTKLLTPLTIEDKGKKITVKPKIVVEVDYEEIQKSPTSSSGYALRFPRVVNLREDKPAHEASTLQMIEDYFDEQRGRNK